jgi:hypothetical protein
MTDHIKFLIINGLRKALKIKQYYEHMLMQIEAEPTCYRHLGKHHVQEM